MADEKEAKSRVVDMTNVKDRTGFNSKHHPPGDYPGKVLKVLDHTSKADNEQWLVVFGLDGKTGEYPYYCGTDADSLWKIRNVYIACGINVPKKKIRLDPTKQIKGKKLGITLDDDEYEGRMRSKAVGVLPLSELTDSSLDEADESDVEVDEIPASNGKAGKKKGKKGKKHSAATVDDDELEELEIEDL